MSIFSRLNCDEGSGYDSGYSGRDSAASLILNNPDFQNSIPHVSITKALERVYIIDSASLDMLFVKSKTSLKMLLRKYKVYHKF